MATTIFVMGLMVPSWGLACRLGLANPAIFAQRLGRAPKTRGSVDLLVHAVAAGEMRAARSLILQTLVMEPELSIVLTTGTRSGFVVGTQLKKELSSVRTVIWLPFDIERILVPWILGLAPKAVVVVETEIWPNLFFACQKLAIPLAIASARLYPSDVGRYRLILPLMKVILACPRWIWLQDQTEQDSYLAIGAPADRLVVLGNAKFATPPNACMPHSAKEGKPLLAAASTHAPEEQWLLEVFEKLRHVHCHIQLVIAPRQITRVKSLARYIEDQGWRVGQLSKIGESKDWDILLIDEYGQLDAWLRSATVIIMGGSFVAKGGQDFVQAAGYAKPVVVGPYLTNFATVAERFIKARALIRLDSKNDLFPTLKILLNRPDLARKLGSRASRAAKKESDAAAQYGHAISRLIHAVR